GIDRCSHGPKTRQDLFYAPLGNSNRIGLDARVTSCQAMELHTVSTRSTRIKFPKVCLSFFPAKRIELIMTDITLWLEVIYPLCSRKSNQSASCRERLPE